MKFTSTVLCFAIAANKVAGNIFDDGSTDYSVLGTNDLSELEYNHDFEVDSDCNYKLEISFAHQQEFFVGDSENCRPGKDDPYDGKPVLAGRWRWERLSLDIRASTGLDHVSIDYNPCGHPGPGFLVPHYDVHYYRVSPDYRAIQMNCEKNYDNPTCLKVQDTPSGRAFFNVARSVLSDELVNMPPGFSVMKDDAVIYMGLHAIDFGTMPNTTGSWQDPVYVICTHDSKIVAVEPMFPFHYVSGTENQFYETDLVYVEQSISDLPSYYSVDFNADTNRTTVVLTGKSNICSQEELDELKEGDGGESGDSSPANTLMVSNNVVAWALFSLGGLAAFFVSL